MSQVPAGRAMPISGEVFREIEAISLFRGARAELAVAGGVAGAEGSVWLEVWGERGADGSYKKSK